MLRTLSFCGRAQPGLNRVETTVGTPQISHGGCFSPPRQDIADDTPLWLGPAVFAAIVNPRLLDVVECVIGAEIYSNPVQHVRIKPPAASLTSGPDDDVVTGLHGRTIDGRVASVAGCTRGPVQNPRKPTHSPGGPSRVRSKPTLPAR